MLEIADTIELERPQDKLIRRLCTTLSGYLDKSIKLNKN